MDTQTLSPEALTHFAEKGYVCIPAALPCAFVADVQTVVWDQLEKKYGIVREDMATWSHGGRGIKKEILDKAVGKVITPRLIGAVNQILGEGQWRPIKTLGGLLLTMPAPASETWERVFDWHCDNDPRTYLDGMDELMLFTFYSHVEAHGGGTLILSGSPRLIEHYLLTHDTNTLSAVDVIKNGLSQWHPLLSELMESSPDKRRSTEALMETAFDIHGVSVQVVELIGSPGDALLCHPAMLHAVSKNCASMPRIMRRTNFRRKR